MGYVSLKQMLSFRTNTPVHKCAFDLNFVQQIGDAGQYMSSTQEGLTVLHQLCHGMRAITYTFLKNTRNQCNSFCSIQTQTSGKTFLS